MEGTIIDQSVLFGAVAQMCLCLAVAFWLFAAVRFVWATESHDRADSVVLAVFSAQVGLVVSTALIDFRGAGVAVAVVIGVVLSLFSTAWAFRSRSMVGNRMKATTLLWMAGFLFAIGTPIY